MKDKAIYSVKMYTQSILLAPFPSDADGGQSNELATAFANRSAVLFHAHAFDDCIKDIDRAIKYHYPEKSVYKLHERKAKCLFNLQRPSEAAQMVGMALDSLSKSELDDKKCRTVSKSLKDMESNLAQLVPKEKDLKEGFDLMKTMTDIMGKISVFIVDVEKRKTLEAKVLEMLLPLINEYSTIAGKGVGELQKYIVKQIRRAVDAVPGLERQAKKVIYSVLDSANEEYRVSAVDEVSIEADPKSEYQYLSDACLVKKTPDKGFTIIARRDIKPGDPVIVEKPYAHAVFQKYKHMYCHHCLQYTFAPVPCRGCVPTIYCSEECRDEAKTYHRYECHCVDELLNESMTEIQHIHLAYRVVTMAGLKTILKHKKYIEKTPSENDKIEKDLELKNYEILYRKETQCEQDSGDYLFQTALIAIFLNFCLKQGNFFEETSLLPEASGMTADEIEDYVGGTLLHFLHSLKRTSIQVVEDEITKNAMQPTFIRSLIGVAAYTTVNLLSHSCDPGIACLMDTSQGCVVRALSTIKAGEEVWCIS